MPRKLAAVLATTFGLAGLLMAADESPLEKKMETVNAKNNQIKKATRTPAAWKKDATNVVKSAEEIAKIGKEFRAEKGPAEKAQKPLSDWTKLMDDMVKASDEMATVAGKSGTTQAQAKDAWTKLNKTCADCHTVFRVDAE